MAKNSGGNHQRKASPAGGRDTMRSRPVTDAQPDPNGNRAERRAADKEAKKKR